jgi:HPt (histidine-containing phosphotransfer) domain-containing protein
MPVESKPSVDESVLDSYRALQEDGQPDVVTEFIDIFLDDLPGRLARLKAAVTANEVKEVRSAAHALKGSSGSVGAAALSGLCALLEANARAGSLDGSEHLLCGIETEAVRATTELRKFRKA